MRGALVPALALALLVVPAAGAVTGTQDGTATPATAGETTSCAPPCGEINPRIMFSFPELQDETVALEKGESATFQGEVAFWMDTDDEGYSPRDPQQPIVIRFSFPRLPAWAEMSAEPTEIEVPVNTCAQCFKASPDDPARPTAHWEHTTTINVTITAVDEPEPTPGYDYGKLQLFAKSTESGIYNPGYGIREIRIATNASEDLSASSTDEASSVPGPGALGALATLGMAAAAVTLQRRLRD